MLGKLLIMPLACLVAAQVHAQGETPLQLKDVLASCSCALPGSPPELLATNVADYSISTDAQGFVVAFKDSLESGTFKVIAVTDGAIQRSEFTGAALGPAASKLIGRPVLSVQRVDGVTFVGISASFSDIVTAVLTPELEPLGAVHGSVLAVLPTGLAIYQRSQDRFAPTHYAELAALDTRTRNEKDIYPPAPPDPIRLERIEHDRQRYEARGVDPARFDNHLWSASRAPWSYAFDSATATLAFSDVYGADGDETEVMVVCAGMDAIETAACHETPLAAWTASLGTSGEDRSDLLKRAAAEPARVVP